MPQQVVTHGGLNIPDTFEVINRDGKVLATYAWAFFKDAEAHVDWLNARDPEGGYTWHRVR